MHSLIRNINTFIKKKKKEGLREIMKRFYDYRLERESIPTEKAISASFPRSGGNLLTNCNPTRRVEHRDLPPQGHDLRFGRYRLNRDVRHSQAL